MFQKTVVILDPAAGCTNLGDEIISLAVQDIVRECSNDTARIVRFSVHQKLCKMQLSAIREADVVIGGGSNLINFRFIPFRDARWNNSLINQLKLRNVWLLGVGWGSYKDKSNRVGRFLYKRSISKTIMHSVRDDFSRTMLEKYKVTNVVNTSCPTMWRLNEQLLSRIPKTKADAAVFTLTDYAPDPDRDRLLIKAIRKNYREVYFWPQGYFDLRYLRSLSIDDIKVLHPTLSAFDEILAGHDKIDYVGTRLHAGIRALQHGRRASIVAVDNRASEISRDTGIPVISREVAEEFDSRIGEDLEFNISLPQENIDLWKEQLRRALV